MATEKSRAPGPRSEDPEASGPVPLEPQPRAAPLPPEAARAAPLVPAAARPAASARPRAADERTYSEEQVAEILRRAAGLERRQQEFKPALSLAEVESIAREAGLDPSLVRVAARSLEESQREVSLGTRLAGAPVRRSIERVLDGELSSAQHEGLIADLRAAVEGAISPAQISSIGRTLTLSARTRAGLVEITISPRGGKTYLRVEVDSGKLAGGLFGGLMGGLGGGLTPAAIALATANQEPIAVGFLAAFGVLTASFALARGIFSYSARSLYRRMERATDLLEARIRDELSAAEPLP